MKRAIIFLVLMVLSGEFFLVACSREKKGKEAGGQMAGHGMPTQWKFTLPQGDAGAGRKIFVEVECYKCHEVKGEQFPAIAKAEKGVGPELSQMAGMHPVEFFAESIMNPNAVMDPDARQRGYLGDDGKSKMPNYNDILTAKQVVDLAAYLGSLKKEEQHKTR
ncbi:MAG: c-type cytochrome [Candidatus Binatia bacterium]